MKSFFFERAIRKFYEGLDCDDSLVSSTINELKSNLGKLEKERNNNKLIEYLERNECVSSPNPSPAVSRTNNTSYSGKQNENGRNTCYSTYTDAPNKNTENVNILSIPAPRLSTEMNELSERFGAVKISEQARPQASQLHGTTMQVPYPGEISSPNYTGQPRQTFTQEQVVTTADMSVSWSTTAAKIQSNNIGGMASPPREPKEEPRANPSPAPKPHSSQRKANDSGIPAPQNLTLTSVDPALQGEQARGNQLQ